MGIERRLSQTITLHIDTPGAEDAHGVPVPGDANEDWPGYLSQQSSSESTSGAVVGESFRLFLGAAAPLGGWDAVTHSGQRYEVIGKPWQVFNPRTAMVSHVAADVRRRDTDG